MHVSRTSIAFVSGGLAALMISALVAARPGAPAPQDAPDPEGMARWMATIQPGEQHELLKQLVGDWEYTARMTGMGPQPMESKGAGSAKAVLGGRFIMGESSGNFMGMSMNEINFLGFDKFKNKFIGVSMSTMGTNMLTMEGTIDQSGKVITMFGPMDEPMTGEHDISVKYVMRFVDPDTHVFEVHDLTIVPGETKVMEITYKRKK